MHANVCSHMQIMLLSLMCSCRPLADWHTHAAVACCSCSRDNSCPRYFFTCWKTPPPLWNLCQWRGLAHGTRKHATWSPWQLLLVVVMLVVSVLWRLQSKLLTQVKGTWKWWYVSMLCCRGLLSGATKITVALRRGQSHVPVSWVAAWRTERCLNFARVMSLSSSAYGVFRISTSSRKFSTEKEANSCCVWTLRRPFEYRHNLECSYISWTFATVIDAVSTSLNKPVPCQ